MIVVDSAVIVDALTLVEGSEGLREELAHSDLNAPSYVALVEALQCPLLTRDARLVRASGHHVEVRVR